MNSAKIIRSVKQQLPFLVPLLRTRRNHAPNSASPEDVFTDIYGTNKWGDKESVSGPGSNLQETEAIRRALPQLWKELNIRTVLDIPCGDFNWMRHVDLNGITYTGGDIVSSLVERNNAAFGSVTCRFIVLDLLSGSLPTADCILCRDCLVHFSQEHVHAALENIKASGSRYLLTTTYPKQRRNLPIATGEWQPLNLQAAPHKLGQPLSLINENCSEHGGAYADKSLAIWRIADIP